MAPEADASLLAAQSDAERKRQVPEYDRRVRVSAKYEASLHDL
jgi:hypothetical protein